MLELTYYEKFVRPKGDKSESPWFWIARFINAFLIAVMSYEVVRIGTGKPKHLTRYHVMGLVVGFLLINEVGFRMNGYLFSDRSPFNNPWYPSVKQFVVNVLCHCVGPLTYVINSTRAKRRDRARGVAVASAAVAERDGDGDDGHGSSRVRPAMARSISQAPVDQSRNATALACAILFIVYSAFDVLTGVVTNGHDAYADYNEWGSKGSAWVRIPLFSVLTAISYRYRVKKLKENYDEDDHVPELEGEEPDHEVDLWAATLFGLAQDTFMGCIQFAIVVTKRIMDVNNFSEITVASQYWTLYGCVNMFLFTILNFIVQDGVLPAVSRRARSSLLFVFVLYEELFISFILLGSEAARGVQFMILAAKVLRRYIRFIPPITCPRQTRRCTGRICGDNDLIFDNQRQYIAHTVTAFLTTEIAAFTSYITAFLVIVVDLTHPMDHMRIGSADSIADSAWVLLINIGVEFVFIFMILGALIKRFLRKEAEQSLAQQNAIHANGNGNGNGHNNDAMANGCCKGFGLIRSAWIEPFEDCVSQLLSHWTFLLISGAFCIVRTISDTSGWTFPNAPHY